MSCPWATARSIGRARKAHSSATARRRRSVALGYSFRSNRSAGQLRQMAHVPGTKSTQSLQREIIYEGEADMATKTLEKELLELEKQYWQAIKDKDVDTAMRLSDDPCIVTGAQGVGSLDRKSLGSMLKAARYTLNDFELKDDAQVRLLGNDVAILAYNVHEDLTVEGKPVTLD